MKTTKNYGKLLSRQELKKIVGGLYDSELHFDCWCSPTSTTGLGVQAASYEDAVDVFLSYNLCDMSSNPQTWCYQV